MWYIVGYLSFGTIYLIIFLIKSYTRLDMILTRKLMIIYYMLIISFLCSSIYVNTLSVTAGRVEFLLRDLFKPIIIGTTEVMPIGYRFKSPGRVKINEA